jgi:C1A family cysteine protease
MKHTYQPRHIYNLRRDSIDHRDLCLLESPLKTIPDSYDLRTEMGDAYPAVKNQGDLGACTGFGITFALAYAVWKATKGTVDLSELFQYFNERADQGTIDQDSGSTIRGGIKCTAKYGVCREATWPYDISKYTVKPSDAAYLEALGIKAITYQRVPAVPNIIKGVIASGYPVVGGISVYESFESDDAMKTGMIPMPNVLTEQLLGGHCVAWLDYVAALLTARNSWGSEVQDVGHFHVQNAYCKYMTDNWVIKAVKVAA